MIKEYWLVRKRLKGRLPNSIKAIDVFNASGLRVAERNFKARNDFKRLAGKDIELIICKAERWLL